MSGRGTNIEHGDADHFTKSAYLQVLHTYSLPGVHTWELEDRSDPRARPMRVERAKFPHVRCVAVARGLSLFGGAS
jgi:hypothetical protein